MNFRCPKCGNTKTRIIDSRYANGNTKKNRRRLCECGHEFRTVELYAIDQIQSKEDRSI